MKSPSESGKQAAKDPFVRIRADSRTCRQRGTRGAPLVARGREVYDCPSRSRITRSRARAQFTQLSAERATFTWEYVISPSAARERLSAPGNLSELSPLLLVRVHAVYTVYVGELLAFATIRRQCRPFLGSRVSVENIVKRRQP